MIHTTRVIPTFHFYIHSSIYICLHNIDTLKCEISVDIQFNTYQDDYQILNAYEPNKMLLGQQAIQLDNMLDLNMHSATNVFH